MEIKLQDEVVLLYQERFKEGKKKLRQILQFKSIPQDHIRVVSQDRVASLDR